MAEVGQFKLTMRHNVIYGNDVGVRIDPGDARGDNVISRNIVTGNGIGIEAGPPAGQGRGPLRITGNQLSGNRAFRNAGHGINAPGVTDRGGNIAFANLLQPQCIGVACATQ
ncbi:MAG: hypothetical protein ACXV5Q_08105 [Frankiaceae bacterium]